MALTDKKYANEHPKFTMFDKYKQDKESLVDSGMADISKKDIATGKLKKKTLSSYSLEELKELGLVNPTLTDDELTRLKEGNVKEPTGQFKKD